MKYGTNLDAKPMDVLLAMRDASGDGMLACKVAYQYAEKYLDGDYVVAILARHANALAVNIKSQDPSVSDEEARRRWNENHARHLAKSKSGEAWEALAAMSRKSQRDPA